MLHRHVPNQVHPLPGSTNGTYPILGFDGVLIVDVAAKSHEIEILGAKRANEVPPVVVISAIELLKTQVQIVSRLETLRGGRGEAGPRIGLHQLIGFLLLLPPDKLRFRVKGTLNPERGENFAI